MISRQVEHTRRLVDDLMDIARIGHNKLELQCTPLDLRDVIRRAAEMAQPEARDRGVPLHVILPETSVGVAGDGTRLVQVFSNLLNNAVKFSEAESSVTLNLTFEAGEAVTRIADRGSGIAPDQLASIFDLFSQAHAHGTTTEAGLGIGLALTRDLVLLHGGTIEARSEGLGSGSEFTVRLPLGRE
ncbi:MAG: sensor histidine kinase, partial [Gammaproteobacteria bacterium]